MLLILLTLATGAPAMVGQVGPPPPALSDIPNLTVHYYDVRGADPRSVRKSIDQSRPSDPRTGERFDGLTRVGFSWRAPGGAGGCQPAKAEFVHTVQISLPRLAEPERLSRIERADWDRYMDALIGHERNHALVGLRGGAELERRFRAAASCEAAQAAADSVRQSLAAAHVEYDERTRHGLLEGAVYPSAGVVGQRRGRSR